MEYQIEVFDTYGRLVETYDDVPLLEVVRSSPDRQDRIRGLLPSEIGTLGHQFRVRALIDGKLFCDTWVGLTAPAWSDSRKLILDKFVPFHTVVEFEAASPPRNGNTHVEKAYTNREVSVIVKDLINRAPGELHYGVAHNAYPEGASRENSKFLARKFPENELEVGGISQGQWVGTPRLDVSGAFAKDGDTISGLVVDGLAWPDLRLMLIDSEETSINSHTRKIHPEVATWTAAQYEASGYKQKADAATVLLQQFIDDKGIDFIELNPHRDATGNFDDRVDVYGRYLGLVYGGGECFNAGMVEQGLASVYLYGGGKFLVPELELKDFFSYSGVHEDSIESAGVTVAELDINGGALEALTVLSYLGNGHVFSVDPRLAVYFRKGDTLDHVFHFDPVKLGVLLGSTSRDLGNFIVIEGSPLSGMASVPVARGESIDEFGLHTRFLDYFSLSQASDATKLAEGLLDDVGYPEPAGVLTFHQGESSLRVGDLVEVRGGPLRRLERELPAEWGGRFTGKLIGRVREIRHRISSKHVLTTVFIGSPLRTVAEPLSFITRGQEAATSLFEFRLDKETVGLDIGFHLD